MERILLGGIVVGCGIAIWKLVTRETDPVDPDVETREITLTIDGDGAVGIATTIGYFTPHSGEKFSVPYREPIEMTATPATGVDFLHWLTVVNGKAFPHYDNPYEVSISQDTEILCVFSSPNA